mmetsp:Transcript_32178/g.78186  ORF Transcript_32178/g.78186 Transcript_32178/m.78186 type:complete len:199 (+) Transcript_32178:74-670(+)|eukprot:CAMPEP_0113639938 /NCGR_PEP_ID=MMETSP0017_2-20120614/20959_1 /TAXON_ID=2856 /ORGANISM="Cylindrotheca closterium" /LENGTH=198 /DNA_ID=CAMNT_0000551191 /DNA_START=47 /DNA_END=643 /DNA_ORIENTATION=- /assembly_acc=CAM_ASM_000147
MKTAAALLALLASASAFTTSKPAAPRTTAVEAAMDDYVGSVNFAGKDFKFDPLKLSETYSPFLPWFRECELRHGRTAMIAVVGFIATDFFRIPGEMYSFESIPKTIDAHDALLHSGPMYQLLLWIGLFDMVITAPAAVATMNGEREAGDYGQTLFAPSDPAAMKKKQESELMNGRLAMCAIGGIATQSIISGHGFPYL